MRVIEDNFIQKEKANRVINLNPTNSLNSTNSLN